MSFSEIIGQATPVSVLKRALASGRTAHAYLFNGIEGCGKKKTALAFAEAIFCNGEDGCGQCSSCRKVAALQHPDLHLVKPDGAFIKIDQIRNLQKELSLRPFEAPVKVCIMEDADKLNPAAANAFLKTLEEPPGNSLLILLATNAGGLLPTIISRCQSLSFSQLSHDTIEKYLQDSGIPAETARMAATLAGGSLSKAIDICREDTLRDRAEILEKIESLSGDEISPVFKLAEQLGQEREKALEAVDMLTLFWRDVLLMHSGKSRQGISADVIPLVERRATQCSAERILENIELILRSRMALQRNVNPRLTLEVMFMALSES